MVDRTDRMIIGLLRRDVRRPYADVADELGLPVDEVEERVRRLAGTGVITLTAVTDPLRLGFAREALLGLTVQPEHLDDVVVALAAFPEVHYLVRATGGFDLLCEVAGTSDAHLMELLSQRITPLPGVARIRTFLYLSTVKLDFDYDDRAPDPSTDPSTDQIAGPGTS